MDKEQRELIETYKAHANKASYHYADDTAKEWGLAEEHVKLALEIFDAHPDLENELREAHKGNLWSLPICRR